VIASQDGGIRLITLNRPDRLNAFTPESYRLLAQALADAAHDDAARVALLSGAGHAFSSGVDLKALAAARGDTSEFSVAFDALVETLVEFPKPLVAAVQGPAVGFGFTILLLCDVVVTASDARLRAPFTALGMAPEAASSWLLPRIVGAQRAAEIFLTSRWISGAEAVELGLSARSCPADELQPTALELARQIAAHSPAALATAKQLLRHDWPEQARAAMARERSVAAVMPPEVLR
jgi:enoyl-CoA hydratase/carnithine racemase